MNPDRQHKDAGAIIIGGDYRGLGAVRSLGRRGIPVCVVTDEHYLAALSRYSRKRLEWPIGSDQEKVEFLLRMAERLGFEGWTLFPTGDEVAALIARNHERLARAFVLTTAPWEITRWAYDKRLTHRLAAELGIPHPWTLHPLLGRESEMNNLKFPLLLKPATKIEPSRFTRDKAWMVRSHAEMVARLEEAARLVDANEIMLQELIPGGGEAQFSYSALCVDGRPRASVTAIRLRQHPVDFGHSSSYVISVEEPEVERLSRMVLSAIHYSGLVEVEFKRDARDGQLKLLDVNPRLWGWHSLGAAAGVDFAYLQWLSAHGSEVADTRGRAGIRWVRMTTDVLAALQQWRSGSFSLGAHLKSLRPPLASALWAADDPVPALCEVPALLLAGIKNRRLVRQADVRAARRTRIGLGGTEPSSSILLDGPSPAVPQPAVNSFSPLTEIDRKDLGS